MLVAKYCRRYEWLTSETDDVQRIFYKTQFIYSKNMLWPAG